MADCNKDNATIVYQGHQVVPFVHDQPITFGPEGKKMVVAFKEGGGTNMCFIGDTYTPNPEEAPQVQTVLAYIPGRKYPVITQDASYGICGEVPDDFVPENKYLPGSNLLCRGTVDVLTGTTSYNTLEILCNTTTHMAIAGNNVLFIAIDHTERAVYDICHRIYCSTDFRLRERDTKLTVKYATRITEDGIAELIYAARYTPDLVVLDYASCLGSLRRSKLLKIARETNVAMLLVDTFSDKY